MGIDRRAFMGLGLALLAPGSVFALRSGSQRLLSCRSNDNGQHFLSMLDTSGNLLMDINLPARGHGVAINPNATHAVVFARRPGDFVWVVDLHTRQVVHQITAPNDRHYYGHGVFTADGSRLLCSENAYESGAGVIGIYDVADGYRRSGEFASHGVGPHEIKMLSDGNTLVVANGGIRTHPDLPRIKSNLASMRPNLAYIDIARGTLLHSHAPDAKWHQLSIRHIDVSADDKVAVAMQYQGKGSERPPLIALQQHDQPLRMLMAPENIQRRLKNYCGSVTFSADGERFAVSSPRGGLVTYWTSEGKHLGTHKQADACGLSQRNDALKGFYISDGNGRIAGVDGEYMALNIAKFEASRWDNHMLSV